MLEMSGGFNNPSTHIALSRKPGRDTALVFFANILSFSVGWGCLDYSTTFAHLTLKLGNGRNLTYQAFHPCVVIIIPDAKWISVL
mmetsp:Transcript_6297/g.20132  ORF Transcript_6297/g.20132 Transcript_6297/m.20132 type:complete len:85 (-) Transcript_6297:262-516(-)